MPAFTRLGLFAPMSLVVATACGSAQRPKPTPTPTPTPTTPTTTVDTTKPVETPVTPDPPPKPAPPAVIKLVVVGDVGLNRNQLPVHPKGVVEGKGHLEWKTMTAGIADLIDGDLNFMNLETVVTDRNDLAPGDKRQKKPYLFRTHPKGVEHLLDTGFNVVSLANNHSYDYGEEGVRETVKHAKILGEERSVVWAGVGLDRESAAAASLFDHKGVKVAFSSIGIVTNMIKFHRATAEKPGSMGYRYEEDWKTVADKLEGADAELRLLSIHYGKERQIASERRQLDQWRWAAREKKVDVVIGHHAHVVRGVEINEGRVIFYGLGNFLIRGARDMGSDPRLRLWGDFGLLAKVYLVRRDDGVYRAAAIEAYPIKDMHRTPRRYPGVEESKKRVEVLNVLAEALDNPKTKSVGVRFSLRDDGTGLYCTDGAGEAPEPVATLCKGWKPPGPPSVDVAGVVRPKIGRRR